MDLDIDMDDVADYELGEAAQPALEPDTTIEPVQPEKPSEATTLVLNKVHITGLDTLSTDEIKAFVAEHYSGAPAERVEWVDDTGANIIYKSESLAHDALVALSAVVIQDASAIPPGEAIDAKPFSRKPDVPLRLRFAVQTDRKQAGAWKRSRYYLFHPEADPEQRQPRGKYRDRGDRRRSDRDYRNPRTGDVRERDDNNNEVVFDASFYDDDDAALVSRAAKDENRRRRRYSPSHRNRSLSRERRERNRDRELFANDRRQEKKDLFPRSTTSSRRVGRRDRSLSPGRDRDGDESMSELSAGPARLTSSRNKDRARSIKERLSQQNSITSAGGKELFPNKLTSTGRSQLDQADEAISKMSIQPPATATAAELDIKGLARQQENGTGISIKGRAAKTAKELFPERFAENTGKELFADRLEGRGRPRRKAEDLFL